MRIKEWQSKPFEIPANEKSQFIKYLSGVWKDRRKYWQDNRDDLEENNEDESKNYTQRFFDFTYDDKIIARNYIGVVQFNDNRIEVVPKIITDSSSNFWHLNLIYWLSYCRKIRFPFTITSLEKLQFDDFLEALIFLFANYTEEHLT